MQPSMEVARGFGNVALSIGDRTIELGQDRALALASSLALGLTRVVDEAHPKGAFGQLFEGESFNWLCTALTYDDVAGPDDVGAIITGQPSEEAVLLWIEGWQGEPERLDILHAWALCVHLTIAALIPDSPVWRREEA